ncbi:hypothetical protein KAR91_53850 [Candidatus Pacearchaeota archaeon]|nr:hypothetical protein [Candidatus Pacearchaeota archaeon]
MGERGPLNDTRALSQVMRNEIEELIESKISEEKDMTKEDMEDILKEVLPDLDKLISDKIKEHLTSLADYISKTMKQEE